MKRFLLPLFLFLFFVLEGAFIDLLPSSVIGSDLIFTPHWVLIFLIYIGVFYDRDTTYYAIMYALIFGFLTDIVYTGILGLYTFAYGLATYVIHELKKLLQGNVYVMVLLGIVGTAVADVAIFIILSLVEIVDLSWQSYAFNRLLPSIGLNLLFLMILYPIFSKRLIFWGRES
jgi:rod shape-determining protein MreD